MASLIAQAADAVNDELNAETFSESFTATRKWVAKWELEDLKKLRVTVLPGPATFEALNRGADEKRLDVDVVIQQRVTVEDNTRQDELAAFLEELIEHFRGLALDAGTTGMICLKRTLIPGQAAAIANPEALTDWRTFDAVLRLNWLMRQ